MAEEFNNEFEEIDIITLTDENNDEMDYEVLDEIEYKGQNYVILVPAQDELFDGEVLILSQTPVPGETDMADYAEVENDEILNAVYDLFKEKNKDIFTFEE